MYGNFLRDFLVAAAVSWTLLQLCFFTRLFIKFFTRIFTRAKSEADFLVGAAGSWTLLQLCSFSAAQQRKGGKEEQQQQQNISKRESFGFSSSCLLAESLIFFWSVSLQCDLRTSSIGCLQTIFLAIWRENPCYCCSGASNVDVRRWRPEGAPTYL